MNTSYAESFINKPKFYFISQKPNFPNNTKKQTLKASHAKGITSRKNIDHWLEGRGKVYQSSKFSEEQIKEAYEKYVNTSSNRRSSSKDLNISIKSWRPVTKPKIVQSQS